LINSYCSSQHGASFSGNRDKKYQPVDRYLETHFPQACHQVKRHQWNDGRKYRCNLFRTPCQ